MRTLELWEGNIRKKYGSVANSSTALERVLLTLQSRSGLQRVLSCLSSGIPIHGVSESQPGLPEVRSLVMEFGKCLAGNNAPNALEPTASATVNGANGSSDNVADAAMGEDVAFAIAETDADPLMTAAQEQVVDMIVQNL